MNQITIPFYKMKHPVFKFLLLLFITLYNTHTEAQNPISDFFPDFNILESNNPAPGYFFLAAKGISEPGASLYIAIIDNYGTPVFFRKMKKASGSMRLMPNGNIAYLNGVPRKLFILNKMLETEKIISIQDYGVNGHDWASDEYGNVLLMGESISYKDMSTLIDGGNSNAEILDVIIQEFDIDGNLKYTWNSADHFDIFDGNENSDYLDYTEAQLDYVHANSVAFDSDTSFILSCRHMDEITKIDRRSGEIIWRMGGKNNQFTFINDPIGFSHQHSISKLKNGNLLVYDNGNLHDTQISTSIIYQLDEINRTATLIKRYGRDPEVYTNHGAGTQQVYNGNIINHWGVYWPSFTEFHADGTVALDVDFTQHSFSPRINKFIWETQVFETDQDSLDFGQLENQTPLIKTVMVTNNRTSDLELTGFSSHSSDFEITDDFPINIPANSMSELHIQFNSQELSSGEYSDVLTLCSDTEDQRIARQLWVFAEMLSDITDIKDLQKDAQSLIHPNPANSNIQIVSPNLDKKYFRLYSLTGQCLFTSDIFTGKEYSFDISPFPRGAYFIVLSNQKTQFNQTLKLIIKD